MSVLCHKRTRASRQTSLFDYFVGNTSKFVEVSGLAPASQRVSTRWVACSIGTVSVTR
jgi:hypothetical protein